jgi:PIN domain nuclease of toxin-antitoxin system
VIVLDTHAWIWFAADNRLLSDAAVDAIRAADRIGVAAISVWEVAMLCAKGRLQVVPNVREWTSAALRLDRVELLPLSPEVAALSTELALHGDPADRIIVATALVAGGQLVTKDDRLRQSGIVPCVW